MNIKILILLLYLLVFCSTCRKKYIVRDRVVDDAVESTMPSNCEAEALVLRLIETRDMSVARRLASYSAGISKDKIAELGWLIFGELLGDKLSSENLSKWKSSFLRTVAGPYESPWFNRSLIDDNHIRRSFIDQDAESLRQMGDLYWNIVNDKVGALGFYLAACVRGDMSSMDKVNQWTAENAR
ncbi:hypothetical protein FEM03_12060 [Phragmitibacter flavus]|uniref:Uncharacterized protein n=1 Tax=Phragmitibacter flavus TaxID=2576071 RepID=A0A5R8KDT2_9BACT|nr:hypothetical protein [Phragmitibacter flavus]TLD70456.1 hypothetical protein FEM03_12060 [Phragmitibacter flavus]